MKNEIEATFRQTAQLHEELVRLSPAIEEMLGAAIEKMRSGATLYMMGNGGSAADAQHMAGELVGRFLMERKPIPAVALTSDSIVLTALANDYAGDLFTRQVQALVGAGDVVLAISTSGNSPNILNALRASSDIGALNLGLSGPGGGAMADLCDHCLCVPHHDTPRIQEAHQTIIHVLCQFLEKELG